MELELLPLRVLIHSRLIMDKLIEQIAVLTEAMHRQADATYTLVDVLLGVEAELKRGDIPPPEKREGRGRHALD